MISGLPSSYYFVLFLVGIAVVYLTLIQEWPLLQQILKRNYVLDFKRLNAQVRSAYVFFHKLMTEQQKKDSSYDKNNEDSKVKDKNKIKNSLKNNNRSGTNGMHNDNNNNDNNNYNNDNRNNNNNENRNNNNDDDNNDNNRNNNSNNNNDDDNNNDDNNNNNNNDDRNNNNNNSNAIPLSKEHYMSIGEPREKKTEENPRGYYREST